MSPHLRTTIAAIASMTATDPPSHALLRLKPQGPITGFVDGAWWPRSRDLPVELPALLTVLDVPLGRVERVCYHLGDWPPARRKLAVAGGVVRLEGFGSQRAGTVTVIGAGDRRRLTLLIVPPETDPELAHHILMTAAHRDNIDSVETLFSARIAAADVTGPVVVHGDITKERAR